MFRGALVYSCILSLLYYISYVPNVKWLSSHQSESRLLFFHSLVAAISLLLALPVVELTI